MTDFIIKVGDSTFKWQNDHLICDNKKLKADLMQRVKFHFPKVILLPYEVDYRYSLEFAAHAYRAILDQYPHAEIIKQLKEEPESPNIIY